MNADSEQIKSIKSFMSISKSVLPISSIVLGLTLVVLIYYKLVTFNFMAIVSAIFSLVALVISITLLIFQKRVSIYFTLSIIISILFISSCLMFGYSNTLSFPEKTYTHSIGIGSHNMGLGLAWATLSIIIFSLNKSGLAAKLKYSKFLMILFFISGIFLFAVGINTFFLGCQYLLNS